MMKLFIFLIIMLAILLLVAENELTTIQVMIVLPPEMLPYYEWLLDFPGWKLMPAEMPEKQPISVSDL